VICISRAWGAGGEEVGRLVAERLGYLFVDEQIILRAAELGQVDPATVADAERRKSLVSRLLDHLGEGGGAALYGAPPVQLDPPSDAVRAFIREAIAEVARRGEVVIVAHAASYAVGPGPESLRVLITGSPDVRAARLAGVEGLGEEQAAREIGRSDAARADYLKRFYRVDREEASHYDLAVGTDTISREQAVELIVQAASYPVAAVQPGPATTPA
jgi:hypothetical protein